MLSGCTAALLLLQQVPGTVPSGDEGGLQCRCVCVRVRSCVCVCRQELTTILHAILHSTNAIVMAVSRMERVGGGRAVMEGAGYMGHG